MKITINDSRKINAIQKEFNEVFPYLKLEFFSKAHTKGVASASRFMKSNTKTLGECRIIHKNGHVAINPSMTVGDLEQAFQDRYGLSLQVFRKSGRSWLETSATDGWTLEKQNAEGEALSNMQYDTKRPEMDLE